MWVNNKLNEGKHNNSYPEDYMFVVKPVTLCAGDEELPYKKSTQLEKLKL